MLLTKECDYGIRVIRALADGKKNTAENICKKEQIPGQYAYKIIKKLEKAGFVKSIRGRGGGYKLLIPLDSITLYDIISAIGNNLCLSECLLEGFVCPIEGNSLCVIHKELGRIQNVFINEMKKETMANLLN